MKITLIKQSDNTFIAAYQDDYEKLSKIKQGEPIEYEWKKQRNPKFHRKFFALINTVYENQERYNNIEHLRKDLIIEAGFYESHFDLQGIEQLTAKSMSFAKMDDIQFSELYNRILDVVVKHFAFDKELLREEIEHYFT